MIRFASPLDWRFLTHSLTIKAIVMWSSTRLGGRAQLGVWTALIAVERRHGVPVMDYTAIWTSVVWSVITTRPPPCRLSPTR